MVRFFYLLKASYLTARTYKIDWYSSILYPLINFIPIAIAIWYGSYTGHMSNFKEIIGADNVFGYYAIGLIYWNYVEMLWPVISTFRNYMRLGFFEEIFITPIKISEYLTNYSLYASLIVTIQSIPLIIILAPFVFITASIIQIFEIIGIFLLSILSSYGFAYILFGITLKLKEGDELISLIGNIAPFCGGLYFPVTILPSSIRVVSYIFPFTWGLDIMRSLIFHSQTILPLTTEAPLFILISIIFFLAGISTFKYMEKIARKSGLQGF